MNNKEYWYAVCCGPDDDDLGYGSFDYGEAYSMAVSLITQGYTGEVIIKTVYNSDAFILSEDVITHVLSEDIITSK